MIEMEVVNVFLGIATFVLGAITLKLEQVQNGLKRKLKRLQKYGASTRLINYKHVDAVLFGPRESGKTTIVELWTSPWTQISEIAATHTWRSYEVNIHEFEEETHKDNLFEIERKRVPTLRARIKDYPGEDWYRAEALKSLGKSADKAVILLIFRVGFHDGEVQYGRENTEYYSKAFVQEIDRYVRQIPEFVSKAIVVFNKADSLPPQWTREQKLRALKDANAEAIHEIERTFSGMLDYQLTSAATNEGIIGLLGKVGKIGVPEDKLEDYEKAMGLLEREFEESRG